MITTIKQAKEVQARRSASGKKGISPAVKRFFLKNSTTYTEESVDMGSGRGVMKRTAKMVDLDAANKYMNQLLS